MCLILTPVYFSVWGETEMQPATGDKYHTAITPILLQAIISVIFMCRNLGRFLEVSSIFVAKIFDY